eukprot:CAMPEP_0184329128 /NCGR_PEP_ID=MMETSP1049-20130417/143982_1 /TAXON_ID=77928 /ORGANISM="Proteomonas sulcata, Strain CCMP704" /LENGTH=488 /DNA_ID=CAMNT_0026651473 /DNA_START=179 /DNA_END=1645 /DNA_ORIENTATION=-
MRPLVGCDCSRAEILNDRQSLSPLSRQSQALAESGSTDSSRSGRSAFHAPPPAAAGENVVNNPANPDEAQVSEDQTPPARPPLPAAPPPVVKEQASPAKSAPSPGSNGTQVGGDQLAALRTKMKETEKKRKEDADEMQKVEDRVIAAILSRTASALQGAKDLVAFVKGHAEMEDTAAKNYNRFSSLFSQESGTTNDALVGYSSACKSMQKLHADLHQNLSAVELKRAEESLQGTDEACKKITTSANRMATDLRSAREKVDKTFLAQEKAWDDCESAMRMPNGQLTADIDPWIAGLKYQAAIKALETLEASHSGALKRLVNDLQVMDGKRLHIMKSVLRGYAESTKNLLGKAHLNADELCNMVEKMQPEQDCTDFLNNCAVKDEDLIPRNGDVEKPSEATTTLGVWIPDEAVRNCNRCQAGFNLLRRKHHCRRCGHVFCDKCSGHQSALPASFGFGNVGSITAVGVGMSSATSAVVTSQPYQRALDLAM